MPTFLLFSVTNSSAVGRDRHVALEAILPLALHYNVKDLSKMKAIAST